MESEERGTRSLLGNTGYGGSCRSKRKGGAMKQENQKELKKTVNGVAPGNAVLLIQKKIAFRAYELYLQRGGVDGHEVEDWLQAEQELLQEERH
jgi:Protein of unknown function (DUF2934)